MDRKLVSAENSGERKCDQKPRSLQHYWRHISSPHEAELAVFSSRNKNTWLLSRGPNSGSVLSKSPGGMFGPDLTGPCDQRVARLPSDIRLVHQQVAFLLNIFVFNICLLCTYSQDGQVFVVDSGHGRINNMQVRLRSILLDIERA